MRTDSAKAAAKWWADQLRHGARLDNGDPSPAGGMSMMLGLLCQVSERAALDTKAIDSFEAALALRFEGIDDTWGNAVRIAGVDYHPDRRLHDAATEVGIDLGMALLPWKTDMYSRGGIVSVYAGYGAPEKIVFAPQGEDR